MLDPNLARTCASEALGRVSFCSFSELFNDWEGRGYDDSVPGEVTKTPSFGDRTT